jgi:hypothetical protein
MAKPTNKYTKKQLEEWWIGRARTAAGYRRNILSNTERSRDVAIIGKMYLFQYDPKHKKTLPVYDKYPLVFPIEPYSDGFLGLNVHYLTVNERHSLLGKLMEYATSKLYVHPKMKINMSYDLIKHTASLTALTRPCVKRYLIGHLRSPLIEIQANEWDRVIELPIQQFIYKT